MWHFHLSIHTLLRLSFFSHSVCHRLSVFWFAHNIESLWSGWRLCGYVVFFFFCCFFKWGFAAHPNYLQQFQLWSCLHDQRACKCPWGKTCPDADVTPRTEGSEWKLYLCMGLRNFFPLLTDFSLPGWCVRASLRRRDSGELRGPPASLFHRTEHEFPQTRGTNGRNGSRRYVLFTCWLRV